MPGADNYVYKFSTGWRWDTLGGIKRNIIDIPRVLTRKYRHPIERVLNGYSEYDWWSFDTYLADVIVSGCIRFRDHGMGYPGLLTEEEWTRRLNIIIEGFTLLGSKFDESTAYGMYSSEQKRTIRIAKFYLMKHFESLWD